MTQQHRRLPHLGHAWQLYTRQLLGKGCCGSVQTQLQTGALCCGDTALAFACQGSCLVLILYSLQPPVPRGARCLLI